MRCQQCRKHITPMFKVWCYDCNQESQKRIDDLVETSRKLQTGNERLRIELKAWGEAGRELLEAIKPGSSKEKQIAVVKEISRLLGP